MPDLLDKIVSSIIDDVIKTRQYQMHQAQEKPAAVGEILLHAKLEETIYA